MTFIYEVSYFKEWDDNHNPRFASEIFKNRKEALSFMVKKQNFAPCLFMFNKKNYHMFKES